MASHAALMPGRKPRDYHHGNLRAELVDAAIAIAEESGTAALSTREVARRLGVSHAAPARHFANREELLAAVATAAYERFTAALGKAAASAEDAEQALVEMGRAYVRFALNHPGLVRLMFSPAINDPAAGHTELQRVAARAYDALQTAVRRTLPARATDERVETATMLAWTTVHGAAMLWLDGPLRSVVADDAEKQFLARSDATIRAVARSIATLAFVERSPK